MIGGPVLTAKEAIKILISLGFVEIRQKGSHKQFRHKTGIRSDDRHKRCHSQKLGARPQKTGRPGNGSA